jgi:hypothetical protein
MSIVTFMQDVHIVDRENGVDAYFCKDDTTEVSADELKLVDAYAKRWDLKGDVYVKGAKDVKDNYVGPRPDSPSFAEVKADSAK